MKRFIGRDYELSRLRGLTVKKSASLVLLKGRRRIGKSRLAAEFASNYTYYAFSGVPPYDGTSDQSERDVFYKQLSRYFDTRDLISRDWWDMLWFLADKAKRGRVVILFDEISWMASCDPGFLGKLKTVWDMHFKQNHQLILILCGSVSTWIEKNILANTGFVGRFSLQLTLRELPINVCNAFFGARANQLSAFDKFKFLSVCGGIPRYLEEWQSNLSVDENINQLCFHDDGILFNEFDQIFYDSLSSKAAIYRAIILHLVDGPLDRLNLLTRLDRVEGGNLSGYLDNLVAAGFVARDHTWHLATKEISKLSRYRLSDNYIRFYLKYIERVKEVVHDQRAIASLVHLPNWSSMVALQFENLVLSNRALMYPLLGIRPEDVVVDGPFFQRRTTKMKGCQVDYLVQTKARVLYVCEVKFSRHIIGAAIIDEMQENLARLSVPRGFSCLPVLIHVNGVSDHVLDSDYFFRTIDFASILEGNAD